jgi:tricarballylate dehydrogenase
MTDPIADVIVIGAGNAAFCAALAAREAGAQVLMLEAAPEEESGGNSRFTAGSIRVAYNGVDDIRKLVPDLTAAEVADTDFGSYSAGQFFDDMARVTRHRADPDLVELLVGRSFATLDWMRKSGVRLIPIYGRQAFKVDGKFKFWGGLTVEAVGGGPGLVAMLTAAAQKRGIAIRYRARALDLLYDGGDVAGVRVRGGGNDGGDGVRELRAKAVVLACGGFEANAEWRTRYLGPGWDLAKVRGSRYNTGDGIRMALAIGASPCGNWSGCHAVQWELNAPEFGDLSVGDQFQKHSYPFGILINAAGRRFVDEGADFRNYTYAKYGRVVLEQPGQFAWQVFDQKVKHLLRDEYRIRQITRVTANSIEEFAQKLDGVDAGQFLATVR